MTSTVLPSKSSCKDFFTHRQTGRSPSPTPLLLAIYVPSTMGGSGISYLAPTLSFEFNCNRCFGTRGQLVLFLQLLQAFASSPRKKNICRTRRCCFKEMLIAAASKAPSCSWTAGCTATLQSFCVLFWPACPILPVGWDGSALVAHYKNHGSEQSQTRVAEAWTQLPAEAVG